MKELYSKINKKSKNRSKIEEFIRLIMRFSNRTPPSRIHCPIAGGHRRKTPAFYFHDYVINFIRKQLVPDRVCTGLPPQTND